jgi:aspartyl-tRNA(Asn)/glutamyl-tRNA(Gln) amidotransferase subunit A
MPSALAGGTTTSRALVEDSLARIADPAGEGARAFIKVHTDAARAMADAMDTLRRAGRAPSRYAGIPVGLKDLFDITGEPTPAGSRALADAPPATANAPVVQRMLAAGFVPVGRTNMTEFAFSGLGINPHYGTPLSPWDRGSARIPGGSSSGTAVAVADGMVAAGLGTDTGGSCRIPAAFCGVVGYKPTARRVPIDGVLPLAPSLDSVGPLAPSVACCAVIDAILAATRRHCPPSRRRSPACVSRCRRISASTAWTPCQRRVRARAGCAVEGRRTHHPRALRDVRCDPGGERQGRLRDGRGLCLASRAAGREGRAVRPAHPRAHRAR